MAKTLREIREKRKLTLAEVAREVGTDAGNLSRIETGSQVPSRDLARGLYSFYDGKVSLAAIYDPDAQIA